MIPVLLTNLRSILITAAVLGIIAAVGAIYWKGRVDANHKHAIETMQAEIADAKKTAELWRAASKRDREQAIADGQLVAKYEEQVEDLLSALEDADRECLTGADTQRMLDAWDIFSSGRPSTTPK